MGSKTIKQITSGRTSVDLDLVNSFIEGEDTESFKVDLLTVKDKFNYDVITGMTDLSTAISSSLSNEITNRYSADQSLSTAIGATGAVVYKGTWDARTVGEGGTGDLPLSGIGFYYIVNYSGSTDLSGITDWKVGDWAIYSNIGWDKVDNTEPDLIAANVVYTNSTYPAISNAQEGLDTSLLATSGSSYNSLLTPTGMTVKSGGVGGISDTTTVGSLIGQTFTQLFDSLLFPTVDATYTNRSASLNIPTSTTVEVGTIYNITSTAIFNRGTIHNGDGTLNSNPLVGSAYNYAFRLPDGNTDGNSASSISLGNSYNIVFNSNRWDVTVSYSGGTGLYYDNKGVAGTNLDGLRVTSTVIGYSGTITGKRYMWYGYGVGSSAPTNSAGVRLLTHKGFLIIPNNTGTFNISIPSTTQEVYFFTVAGRTVKVYYVESSMADVTSSFNMTSISVNDAGGISQSYESWVSYIGLIGYPSIATYRVIIT